MIIIAKRFNGNNKIDSIAARVRFLGSSTRVAMGRREGVGNFKKIINIKRPGRYRLLWSTIIIITIAASPVTNKRTREKNVLFQLFAEDKQMNAVFNYITMPFVSNMSAILGIRVFYRRFRSLFPQLIPRPFRNGE